MEEMDGLRVAKQLRDKDNQVIIIFITNMAQMAIRGYEVQALDFIVKPVNYYSFAMKIKNAVHIIPMQNGMRRISTDDLYYAEIRGHYLYYHTVDGVFRQKTSLKELEDKLAGLSFKRCNHCYLVNLKYVDCVNKDDLQINGEWLKISRPKKREFLQSLANYMGGVRV